MSTQILWYDEQERPKGVLAYDSAVHEEDLDGIDKLTVVTRRNAEKRDRLIWKDNAGYWHEHIVDEISTTHHGGAKRHTLTCSNSISELFRIEAPGTKAKKRVSEHLADVCAGTRWNAGNSSGTVVEVETWHKSVRECMTELCNQCGGELVTHIDVDDNGVISRTVRIVVNYGTKIVKRTFTYGHNMGAVKREVAADEVYTAVRGYGAKTAETAWQAHIDDLQDQYDASTDSNVRRKLQKRINAAREKLKAVQDNDYAERLKVEVKKNSKKRNRWGLFNGHTMQHSWYIYTDDNCTSRQFLRRQCNALLKSLCNPLVRYEFDTAEVDSEMWHDVRLGSKVLCVDPVFEGGAAIERVSHIKRNLSGTMQCRIAIGKRANPQIDQYKTTQRLSKITTGNGVKTQSYNPTSSGGNYSGVGGYSQIGQYEVDGETFTIGDGAQPAAIQVITPPAKTEYYVNDEIDYSGIEVQLLRAGEEVYTSDAYPDGMIPFEELEFSEEIARIDFDHIGEYRITDDSVFYGGETRKYNGTLHFFGEDAAGFDAYRPNGDKQRFDVKFSGSAPIVVAASYRNSYGGLVWFFYCSTESFTAMSNLNSPNGSRGNVTISHYVVNDKDVYCGSSDSYQTNFTGYGFSRLDGYPNFSKGNVDENRLASVNNYIPQIPGGSAVVMPGLLGYIALYGTSPTYLIDVPVIWASENGNELETFTPITVQPTDFEYSTSAFESTGGGRF